MKQVTVQINLTDREVATIKEYGFKIDEYVTSIVHYDLEKIRTSKTDKIRDESIIDVHFM